MLVHFPGFAHAEDPSRIQESADYILLLCFDEDHVVKVGALEEILLERGTYAYCGSAKAGLWGRVRRHLSDPLKKRWHIDRITTLSTRIDVFWKAHTPEGECSTASHLSDSYESVKGFGCSDCRCASHLFYLGE